MDRNPSPPPEESENSHGDVIGSTVYSQRFVLKCLVSVLKETKNDENEAPAAAAAEQPAVDDLDLDLDNRLCLLWDMSTDHEVAKFLYDHNVLDIFDNAMRVTNKPRLTEILMGIIANMVCSEAVVTSFKNNETVRDLILNMFSCRDPQTLIETARCLKLCLEKNIWSDLWEEKFISLDLWDDFLFIAKSTANESLMLHISECCDNLIDKPNMMANFLDKNNSIVDLIEILHECVREEQLKACSYWLHCLQTLTTTENSGSKLVEYWDAVAKLILEVLTFISKRLRDIELNTEEDYILLACCLSLINWNTNYFYQDHHCKTVLNAIATCFEKRKTDDEENSYYQLAKKELHDILENIKNV